MFQFEPTAAALVVRPGPVRPGDNRYLQVSPVGDALWVDDPAAATAFPSMREATRAALRLPGTLRAFSLPRTPELALHTTH